MSRSPKFKLTIKPAFRPKRGATVYRVAQMRVDIPGERGVFMGWRVQSGVVLAVVTDGLAMGGWVALIRWFWPRRRDYTFEPVEASAFDHDHQALLAVRRTRRQAQAALAAHVGDRR